MTGTPAPVVAAGALDRLGALLAGAGPAPRAVLVTDEIVGSLYATRAGASLPPDTLVLTVPPGERQKSRDQWARLTDAMLEAGLGRDTLVIALGGGVVGDLAGFVAGTYMRGVPLALVPTTLVAMIDASIGGKTGVDTPAGKNLVGVFHDPVAVIADPEVLATLPARELRAGFAEALKHGVVADAAYFDRVMADLPALRSPGGASGASMFALVMRSIEIKREIVAGDAREAGRRKILNFGHTIGHALELVSDLQLPHGEAVAIGMALEADIAERLGVAEPGTARRVRAGLHAAGLPDARPRDLAPALIARATRSDKKARGGQVEFALPTCIGSMAGAHDGWTVRVDEHIVLDALG